MVQKKKRVKELESRRTVVRTIIEKQIKWQVRLIKLSSFVQQKDACVDAEGVSLASLLGKIQVEVKTVLRILFMLQQTIYASTLLQYLIT